MRSTHKMLPEPKGCARASHADNCGDCVVLRSLAFPREGQGTADKQSQQLLSQRSRITCRCLRPQVVLAHMTSKQGVIRREPHSIVSCIAMTVSTAAEGRLRKSVWSGSSAQPFSWMHASVAPSPPPPPPAHPPSNPSLTPAQGDAHLRRRLSVRQHVSSHTLAIEVISKRMIPPERFHSLRTVGRISRTDVALRRKQKGAGGCRIRQVPRQMHCRSAVTQ